MLRLVSTVVLGLAIPMVAGAQDVPAHDGFETRVPGSTAPTAYGWKLDGAEVSTTVTIPGPDGDRVQTLNLSAFFECGVALGREAASYEYDPGCGLNVPGPLLHIYPAGALVVPRKNSAFDPADIDVLLAQPVSDMRDLPDLFMPRLGDAAPLAGAGACPDPHGTRGVYFYATRLDPAAAGQPEKMVITWNDILPAGDCDAAPNSFQMIVTALPLAPNAGNVRPPARVEFRYGDCGWAVPDQDAVPPAPRGEDGRLLRDLADLHGARSGILFNSAAAPGGDVRRAIEVLGARERDFTVQNEGADDAGALAHDRQWGASGDPRRYEDFCIHSNLNLPPSERPKGHFLFELTSDGIPLKDDDQDGVPDGEGGYDNCEGIANPYQGDADESGGGDACDPDADRDGVLNADEYCDLQPPSPWDIFSQEVDTDGDGLGDGCDVDLDNDGVTNYQDNCPQHPNPSQLDWDVNGDGMRCDSGDEALFARLARLLAAAADAGWLPPPQMVEVIEIARARHMTLLENLPPFAEHWATESGKSADEVWTLIHMSLETALTPVGAAQLRTAVAAAYAKSDEAELWLLQEWSKTELGLGEYVSKHGGWFVEAVD